VSTVFEFSTRIKRILSYSFQFVEFLLIGLPVRALFPRRTNSDVPNKILVFRTDAIGDFLLSISAIQRLKHLYAGYHHVLLVHPAAAQLAQSLDLGDEIWEFHREKFIKNPFYHCLLLIKIRRAGFHTAICLNYSREILGDEVIFVSGANERIGWNGNTSRISLIFKRFTDRFYTKLVSSIQKQLHELKRNFEFVSQITNCSDEDLHAAPINQLITRSESMEILQDLGLTRRRYCILVPGSRIRKKMWSLSNFAQIIEWLHAEFQLRTVIIGSKGEEGIGRELSNQCIVAQPISVIGQISFQESINLMGNSSVVVTNDNAMAHIAVLLDLNMVSVLGGGQFGRFAPYGNPERQRWVFTKLDCYNCDWVCKYSHYKCIQDVPVEAVKTELRSLLS